MTLGLRDGATVLCRVHGTYAATCKSVQLIIRHPPKIRQGLFSASHDTRTSCTCTCTSLLSSAHLPTDTASCCLTVCKQVTWSFTENGTTTLKMTQQTDEISSVHVQHGEKKNYWQLVADSRAARCGGERDDRTDSNGPCELCTQQIELRERPFHYLGGGGLEEFLKK